MATLPPGLTQNDFNDAVNDFIKAVGKDWVYTSDAHLEGYRDGYSPFWGTDKEPLPSAAVAPANVEEVQKVVQIANKYKIPFWINSTGKNFGYGGPAGVVRGTVNLDLRRMNKILEINEKHAYVLVEPGVTFFDLYNELQRCGLRFWTDVPGPGWGSVLGNTIEYGMGYTDYGQRVNFQCGMEVVLPSGELLRTGQGAIPGSKTWQQYKRNLGPRIDELFFQTNYGVVTKMGLWLMPEPPTYIPVKISSPEPESIIPMIDVMRPMRHSGVINNNATVSKNNPPGTLPRDETEENHRGWYNSLAFYGMAKGVEERFEFVTEAYRKAMPNAKIEFERYDAPHDMAKIGESRMARGMAGIPGMLAMIHNITFSVVLPFEGQEAWDCIQLFDSIAKKYGHRYFGRSHHAESPHSLITTSGWDIKYQDEKYNQAAIDMVKEWITESAKNGWSAYRVMTPLMDQTMATYSWNDNALLKFFESLKDTLDPNGVIAPGKNGIWPQHMREAAKKGGF